MSRAFVICGVAGCGKSTIGAKLAKEIDAIFIDGDDLHPQSNVDKMASGQPLTDEDRAPWLEKVGKTLAKSSDKHIIACSALKRSYRDIIRNAANQDVTFIFLSGSRDLIETRMAQRKDHFMPTSLLDSQFATLEEMGAEEHVIEVDITPSIADIVTSIAERV